MQARFFRAMGSPCELKMRTGDADHFDHAAAVAQEEVFRLERKYSRYQNDSVLSDINRSAENGDWVAVDEETRGLLAYADVAWAQSDGRFDITSGVLRKVWDFKSASVPDAAAVSALLDCIGWQKVELRDDALRLTHPGMELDFGGIVKEYAVDRVIAKLAALTDDSFLISLGGDLAVKTGHGDTVGASWKVGVSDPSQRNRAIASIELDNGAVCSSGDYERCFVVDGVRYSHLLDPHTGYPVQGPRAVSVKADQCIVAGTLATIAMLMPSPDAAGWLDEQALSYVLVDESGKTRTNNVPISTRS